MVIGNFEKSLGRLEAVHVDAIIPKGPFLIASIKPTVIKFDPLYLISLRKF